MNHFSPILAVVLLIVVALSNATHGYDGGSSPAVETRAVPEHDWFEQPKSYFSEYWFDGFWLDA